MQMLSSRQFAVIATVIEYLYEHLDQQPSLDDVASHMNLSPSYIQRQFQHIYPNNLQVEGCLIFLDYLFELLFHV